VFIVFPVTIIANRYHSSVPAYTWRGHPGIERRHEPARARGRRRHARRPYLMNTCSHQSTLARGSGSVAGPAGYIMYLFSSLLPLLLFNTTRCYPGDDMLPSLPSCHMTPACTCTPVTRDESYRPPGPRFESRRVTLECLTLKVREKFRRSFVTDHAGFRHLFIRQPVGFVTRVSGTRPPYHIDGADRAVTSFFASSVRGALARGLASARVACVYIIGE
jgi:hypothetical protein